VSNMADEHESIGERIDKLIADMNSLCQYAFHADITEKNEIKSLLSENSETVLNLLRFMMSSSAPVVKKEKEEEEEDTGVDEVTNRFNRACTIEPIAATVKQGTGT